MVNCLFRRHRTPIFYYIRFLDFRRRWEALEEAISVLGKETGGGSIFDSKVVEAFQKNDRLPFPGSKHGFGDLFTWDILNPIFITEGFDLVWTGDVLWKNLTKYNDKLNSQ